MNYRSLCARVNTVTQTYTAKQTQHERIKDWQRVAELQCQCVQVRMARAIEYKKPKRSCGALRCDPETRGIMPQAASGSRPYHAPSDRVIA